MKVTPHLFAPAADSHLCALCDGELKSVPHLKGRAEMVALQAKMMDRLAKAMEPNVCPQCDRELQKEWDFNPGDHWACPKHGYVKGLDEDDDDARNDGDDE
jgi:hypothetical protein